MVDYQWAGKEIGNPNPNPRFARSMCQNSEITCCHYVKKVHILLVWVTPIQETAGAGETGSTIQWPGTRSAEVASHQERTWKTTYVAGEDDEACRRDPNLYVYDLPE
ncbi:uncharacterized protein N7487_007004 [Penicillium crustosum]|uniref:uncharacterized protein n=1 Tax=Penicillium crustosum TaxID=36656 RepID=UPI00238B0ECC|nr:uncharacterized protein N7487_007004 [Penicillium crustosum]KAJ5412645.1 hypothetical protein N7487_007004 [Penicillium crustosum]